MKRNKVKLWNILDVIRIARRILPIIDLLFSLFEPVLINFPEFFILVIWSVL